MTRLSMCALSTAAAALVLCISSVAGAAEIELKNDALTNNSQGKAICGFNVGEGFGVRFTPPAYPAKLRKIRVLMTNVGLSLSQCNHVAVASDIPLSIEVFQTTTQIPGTSLLQSSANIGNDTVLNEFDVSAENASIQDGAFFVAFTLQSDKASPMIDQGATLGDGNYIYGATKADAAMEWFSFGQLGSGAPNGNWAVRITVDVPGGDGGAAGGTQDGGQAGAAGAAGSIGDASVDGAAGAGPQPPPESAEGGGCSASGSASGAAGAIALSMLGLACALRRRRRG